MPGPNGASYVTPAQLLNYLPAATLNLATAAQQLQACADATSRADSYLNNKYEMPILAWGNDLTVYTAYIALFLLMNGPVGYATQAGSDDSFARNYASAVGGIDPRTGGRMVGWFQDIQRDAIQPDITPSIPTAQDPVHQDAVVTSQAPRGWQQVSRCGKPVVGGF